jgi:hypothetical protein
VRTPGAQRTINETLAMAFRSDAGQAALVYLKAITINAVCGPEISDAGLRHREGMRHLVAIIDQRIEAFHRDQQRSTATSGPATEPRPRRTRRLRAS